MMTKNQLKIIKNQIRQNIPSLRYKDFGLWEEHNKIKIQCYIYNDKGIKEWYGNIYEVVNIDNGLLKVNN